MSNSGVEDEDVVFKKHGEYMKKHLKPLFIWAKVDGVGVNKVLVDGGAAINLMPNFLLKKIGKKDIDLRPHNMVLSDYKGKTCKALAVLLVNIDVGMMLRPTLFYGHSV